MIGRSMSPANPPIPTKKSIQKVRKPQWRSYKNPEVKHELILYGELAAVAAGIVALYLLALVPFAHIQRVQLLTARLKPNGLEMADADRFVKLANDSLFQEDSEVNKFQYRLTKRPCGSKDDIGLQTDQKCGSTKDAQIYQVKNMIKAKFVAYQDFSQIFTIQCCHPEKTAPLCPCGIPYRHGKWCFEL
uniref:Uncharacterized protein n=1 Tax=Panagrolaimus sp. JU765 TaxID=591449 RepID=A0AC34R455_9BILA